ncbi:NADPH oxidase 1 isoform X2 [Tympanuchus pallidicinctus]|uniref:NADPH oxidase 1 isoform X2 n=1 Tax=Tympanuchus pallidicinctus TaxID=109042 RepID=UPI0022875CC4|nr:NADPH oxidase 1 isoform X2 [Tympanuchus pallidicinctus]
MGNWLVNHWFSATVFAAWLGINIFLFTYYFLFFDRDERYFYTRAILGSALAWARASAKCLNFNSMLILLPVCRNLLSFLRGSCSVSAHGQSHRMFVPIPASVPIPTLPPLLAVLQEDAAQAAGPQPHLPQVGGLCAGPVHSCAYHCPSLQPGALQLQPASQRWQPACCPFQDAPAGQQQVAEPHPFQPDGERGSTAANPLPCAYPDPILLPPLQTVEYVAFTTIPGLTGVIITLALILMVTSSTEFIRRNYFEVFWYTHHLFIIYFIGLVIHGVAGLVRGQTEESMKEVHPQRCAEFLVHKPKECRQECCKEPEFGSIPAESWKWVLAPIILYIFERILRIWRARQKVVVTKVVMHPAKVLELHMQKKGFRMEVGQYIFVNCPAVSLLEWHPFTLTSAPEEDFFSIHIRAAGDWTERIIDTFQQQKLEIPRIEVDGPFGTASEDVFLYEVAMLVGAGIGVTPFASILKSIWYRFQQNDQTLKTKKVLRAPWDQLTPHLGFLRVQKHLASSCMISHPSLAPSRVTLLPHATASQIYFYWLCRDTGAFAWFNDLLASLEQKMAESGKADFLTYRLFLTGWDTSIANNAALNFDTVTDTVTGLRQKTIFGRPRWDIEFSAVATAHPRSVVGVFLCGPEALAKVLQRSCHQHSSLDPRKVKFYFNKENF